MGSPNLGDQYQDVMGAAAEFARGLRHDFIGTEHLLIAMMRVNCTAGSILNELLAGIGEKGVMEALLEITGEGEEAVTGSQPLTLFAKRATELALRSAIDRGAEAVHSEDLLLGIVRTPRSGEGLCVALQILEACVLEHEYLEAWIKNCNNHLATAPQDK